MSFKTSIFEPSFYHSYLTVTLHVTVFFPAFTLMVALPFLSALTTPFAETVATFLLELV